MKGVNIHLKSTTSKLRAELAKNTEKIEKLEARNQELRAEIEKAENTEIIGIVRASGYTPEALAALLSAGAIPIQTVKEDSTDEA